MRGMCETIRLMAVEVTEAMKVAIGSVSHGDTNGVGWIDMLERVFSHRPRLIGNHTLPYSCIAAPPNAYAAAAEAVPFHAPGLPAAHGRQTTIHPLAAALSA